jgi:hypothetical protein
MKHMQSQKSETFFPVQMSYLHGYFFKWIGWINLLLLIDEFTMFIYAESNSRKLDLKAWVYHHTLGNVQLILFSLNIHFHQYIKYTWFLAPLWKVVMRLKLCNELVKVLEKQSVLSVRILLCSNYRNILFDCIYLSRLHNLLPLS